MDIHCRMFDGHIWNTVTGTFNLRSKRGAKKGQLKGTNQRLSISCQVYDNEFR